MHRSRQYTFYNLALASSSFGDGITDDVVASEPAPPLLPLRENPWLGEQRILQARFGPLSSGSLPSLARVWRFSEFLPGFFPGFLVTPGFLLVVGSDSGSASGSGPSLDPDLDPNPDSNLDSDPGLGPGPGPLSLSLPLPLVLVLVLLVVVVVPPPAA